MGDTEIHSESSFASTPRSANSSDDGGEVAQDSGMHSSRNDDLGPKVNPEDYLSSYVVQTAPHEEGDKAFSRAYESDSQHADDAVKKDLEDSMVKERPSPLLRQKFVGDVDAYRDTMIPPRFHDIDAYAGYPHQFEGRNFIRENGDGGYDVTRFPSLFPTTMEEASRLQQAAKDMMAPIDDMLFEANQKDYEHVGEKNKTYFKIRVREVDVVHRLLHEMNRHILATNTHRGLVMENIMKRFVAAVNGLTRICKDYETLDAEWQERFMEQEARFDERLSEEGCRFDRMAREMQADKRSYERVADMVRTWKADQVAWSKEVQSKHKRWLQFRRELESWRQLRSELDIKIEALRKQAEWDKQRVLEEQMATLQAKQEAEVAKMLLQREKERYKAFEREVNEKQNSKSSSLANKWGNNKVSMGGGDGGGEGAEGEDDNGVIDSVLRVVRELSTAPGSTEDFKTGIWSNALGVLKKEMNVMDKDMTDSNDQSVLEVSALKIQQKWKSAKTKARAITAFHDEISDFKALSGSPVKTSATNLLRGSESSGGIPSFSRGSIASASGQRNSILDIIRTAKKKEGLHLFIGPEPVKKTKHKPVSSLFNQLMEIYDAKERDDADRDLGNLPRQDFAIFVYKHVLKKEMSKVKADLECWNLVRQLEFHAKEPAVDVFTKFLYEKYNLETLNFYLYVRRYLRESPYGISYPVDEGGLRYVCTFKTSLVSRAVFRSFGVDSVLRVNKRVTMIAVPPSPQEVMDVLGRPLEVHDLKVEVHKYLALCIDQYNAEQANRMDYMEKKFLQMTRKDKKWSLKNIEKMLGDVKMEINKTRIPNIYMETAVQAKGNAVQFHDMCKAMEILRVFPSPTDCPPPSISDEDHPDWRPEDCDRVFSFLSKSKDLLGTWVARQLELAEEIDSERFREQVDLVQKAMSKLQQQIDESHNCKMAIQANRTAMNGMRDLLVEQVNKCGTLFVPVVQAEIDAAASTFKAMELVWSRISKKFLVEELRDEAVRLGLFDDKGLPLDLTQDSNKKKKSGKKKK